MAGQISQSINNPSSVERKPSGLLNRTVSSSSIFKVIVIPYASIDGADRAVAHSKLTSTHTNTHQPSKQIIGSGLKIEEKLKLLDDVVSSSERNVCVEKTYEKGSNVVSTESSEKTNILKNQGKYVCELCGKKFTQLQQLHGHLQEHSGDFMWACDLCPEGTALFCSLSRLKKHEKTSHSSHSYKCTECSAPFSSLLLMKRHQKHKHSNIPRFLCQFCEKSFHKRSDLRSHISVHLDLKLSVCEVCGRSFNHISNLIRHSYLHTENKPYPCKVCGKRFNQLTALKHHNISQHESSPFPCPALPTKCVKVFRTPSIARQHALRMHPNVDWESSHKNSLREKLQRSFYCRVCGESFQRLKELRTHALVHKSEKSVLLKKYAMEVKNINIALNLKSISNPNQNNHKKESSENHINGDLLEGFQDFENHADVRILESGQQVDSQNLDLDHDQNVELSKDSENYKHVQDSGDSANCVDGVNLKKNIPDCDHFGDHQINVDSKYSEKLCFAQSLKDDRNFENLEQSCIAKDIQGSEFLDDSKNQSVVGIQAQTSSDHSMLYEVDRSLKGSLKFADTEFHAVNSDVCDIQLDALLKDTFLERDISDINSSEINSGNVESMMNKVIALSVDVNNSPWIQENSGLPPNHIVLEDGTISNQCSTSENNFSLETGNDNEIVLYISQMDGSTQEVRLKALPDHYFVDVKGTTDDVQPVKDVSSEISEARLDPPDNDDVMPPLNVESLTINQDSSKEQQPKIKKCPECGKCFEKMTNLKQHLGTHFVHLQRYRCNICGQHFSWKSTLNKHIAGHHSVPSLKALCDTCGKQYGSISQVQEHVRRDHLQLRPHGCQLCSKTFFKKHDLQMHVRVHTQEKPYMCDTCGKNFLHISHLRRHELVHQGIRKHQCNTCGSQFSQASGLKAHMNRRSLCKAQNDS